VAGWLRRRKAYAENERSQLVRAPRRASELIGLHTGDVSAAYAAGLSCRPIEETVADTWAWLQAEGDPPPAPDRPAHGVDPGREREVLAMAAGADG
jgi:hypothetical protein